MLHYKLYPHLMNTFLTANSSVYEIFTKNDLVLSFKKLQCSNFIIMSCTFNKYYIIQNEIQLTTYHLAIMLNHMESKYD